MYCEKCGKCINADDKFCISCGAKIENLNSEESDVTSEKYHISKKVILIMVAFGLIICAFALVTYFYTRNFEKDKIISTTSLNITSDIVTTESKKDNATKKETTTKETTIKSTTEATTVDAGKLYRPSSDKFCNQYQRYISGNFEGQGYAKMRFGPSKSKYNVVGQIDNGNIVTVQTESVDGWTLIYYQGAEGWVRTDFLFATYEECFDRIVLPDYDYNGICAYVDVYGEYDGQNLNMRSGPSKDYTLITKVPDGADVSICGRSDETDEWIYILYGGNYGWVLSEYVFEYSGEAGDKPVLYLYPEKETDVTVKVELNDMHFTCTYPDYNDGWSVLAKPDGTLINNADGREYSYLYWELGGKHNYDFSTGFVVKGEDTADFLQQKLSEMGLTPREYNEFIVYWLPKMQNNKYNLISFQFEKYTDNVKLNIEPKPESMLRVFMAYKAIDEDIKIEPQSFDNFERKGFTVVEWGGVEVK